MTGIARPAAGWTRRQAAAGLATAPSLGFRAAPDDDPAALTRFLAGFNPRLAPGLSAALVRADGRTAAAARGFADPERRAPMTPATRLMSGSTGKTFCAATAMRLVEAGVLDLDRPLAPLFADEPWFKRLPNASSLTVRLLLMHAAGFPQFLDVGAFQRTFLADALVGRDTGYSPHRMLSFILDAAPVAPPGRRHHYSDLGYHLVGITLEKLTGRPYYVLLRDLILSRFASADVLPADRRALPGLAAGYARGSVLKRLAGVAGRSTDEAGRLRLNPALEYTGGGLALTPRALAGFFAGLAAGRVVSPASFAEMMRSRLPVTVETKGVTSGYGLGLFVTRRPGLGLYVSHSGEYPGYSSNVGYFLDHGFAAAVQQNTDHGPDVYDLLRGLAQAALEGSSA